MNALIVVDMQRYYLEADSPFQRYFRARHPRSMDYITERCEQKVLPHIELLLGAWRKRGWPVLFLRLCGRAQDRSDLHPHFQESHRHALQQGFHDLYPLESEAFSDVSPRIAPQSGEAVFCKTTYSGFTTSGLGDALRALSPQRLVFVGLATSQCVETTARDASDRGYRVVHVEDAQADYEEMTHQASLYSSQGVCGGEIVETLQLLKASRLE